MSRLDKLKQCPMVRELHSGHDSLGRRVVLENALLSASVWVYDNDPHTYKEPLNCCVCGRQRLPQHGWRPMGEEQVKRRWMCSQCMATLPVYDPFDPMPDY